MGTVTGRLLCDISICLLIRRGSGRELLCMLHECWAGAQGVDFVRQAIVIRYEKVGIRAMGHKTHTRERGRAGLRHRNAHARAHIHFHYNKTRYKLLAKWVGQR